MRRSERRNNLQIWTRTDGADSLLFLIHVSGSGQHQCVVVYAAEGKLRHLWQSDAWFMADNYAMSPGVFEQLYVTRAHLWFPVYMRSFLGRLHRSTKSCFKQFSTRWRPCRSTRGTDKMASEKMASEKWQSTKFEIMAPMFFFWFFFIIICIFLYISVKISTCTCVLSTLLLLHTLTFYG